MGNERIHGSIQRKGPANARIKFDHN